MQEFPQAGGASDNRRTARPARLFATFKLAAPTIEIVEKSMVAGQRKPAANVNRVGVVVPGPLERA
jgi:hypothetical protein